MRQPTRSIFQLRIVITCFVLLCLFYVVHEIRITQLDLEDALFLTKNSFRQLRQQYLPSKNYDSTSDDSSVGSLNINDIEYPLNNMVNSIFPIDSKIKFNISERHTTAEIIARYASFSPILNDPIKGHYKIFPTNGCSQISDGEFAEYQDKILIVLRGDCTFVDKVNNIINSNLNPKTIMIANDEPMRGLITMYSSTFNQDGSLTTPIMFITNESYKTFYKFKANDLVLDISTASLGSWINVIISMILSPPLLILFFYCLIQFIHNCKKIQNNKYSQKIVKKLPVYIYNKNHLIHYKQFQKYLKVTGQIDQAMDSSLSSSILSFQEAIKPTPSSSSSSLNNFIINGVNVKQSPNFNVLIMNQDFYPSFKCSICLDRFRPLHSRVLILDCKHFFHENCLSNWLINFKRSCPLCNNIIRVNSQRLLAGQVISYGSFDESDIESQNEYRTSVLNSGSNDGSNDGGNVGGNTGGSAGRTPAENSPYMVYVDDPQIYHEDQNVTESPQNSLQFTEYNNHSDTGSQTQNDPLPLSLTSSTNEVFHTPPPTTRSQSSNSASFFTPSNRFDKNSPTIFSKPLQILSQFSTTSNTTTNSNQLSLSIDSGNEYLNSQPFNPSSFNPMPLFGPQLQSLPLTTSDDSNDQSTIELSS